VHIVAELTMEFINATDTCINVSTGTQTDMVPDYVETGTTCKLTPVCPPPQPALSTSSTPAWSSCLASSQSTDVTYQPSQSTESDESDR